MNTVEMTAIQPGNINTGTSTWKDWLGITASIGCAIHCAAMPFVIAYLPALGLSFLADEAFHKWMALICFLIAIAAFVPGIRKHGNWMPISVGAIGLAFITYAAFGLAGECCPSCDSVAAASATPAAMASVDATTADDGCEHCEHCEGCQSEDAVASAESTTVVSSDASEEKGELLSTLAPWITPFGGFLLVGAHLLNRRYGCLCGCC